MTLMTRQSLTAYAAPLCETVVDCPKPQKSEVLVRIRRCGVCHSDVHLQDGYFLLGGDKRLDVIQVFEPYASLAVRAGAKVLYAASTRGPTVYTTFLATRAGIARHRDAFAALTRAIERMQHWLTENGAETLAEAVAPFYPDVEGDVLTSAMDRYRRGGLWSRSTEVSRQGFARLGESLLSGGYISRAPVYADCVDETLGPGN